MSNPLPPDLRVLCRKLTSIPPTQLPHALPSLINHVLRCRDVLSAPQDSKPKDDASQSSMLTHKLKASITTLLNSRSREARFAAIGLVKAAVDVGGWEVLRGCEPWARGLISIVQKGDPFASKELAIVTLTRIYTLVHPYQTLVREIATPHIPDFATACIQLIKLPASGEPLSTPQSLVETICDAFSTLIPFYPATFRPFSARISTATRVYLAPTVSDNKFTPVSLRQAARHVNISLHYVAAKSSGSDEWAKLVDGILQELHQTADQVLRAIKESWEPADSQFRPQVDFDVDVCGGGAEADQYPRWFGTQAGAERLIGLFNYLSDCLRYPTKASVPIPIISLVDAVSRLCLVARLSPKSQTWDQALETNAAIGRDEKDDLWSTMPDIHISALQLLFTLFERFGRAMLPLLPEVLDHLVRVCMSGLNIPAVRSTSYVLLKTILPFGGPTLSKSAVEMLEPLIGACCRDLQQEAGFLKPSDKPTPLTNDSKKNGVVANADLFLKPKASEATEAPGLGLEHHNAASELLAAVLSLLPQQHLKPTVRGLLDKTAILTRNRDAMLASVLNPFKDQRGRLYPSILPHLSRQYPHDQGLEILRSNLRSGGAAGGAEMFASVDEMEEEEEEEEEGQKGGTDEQMQDELEEDADAATEKVMQGLQPGAPPTAFQVETDLPIQSNPFEARLAEKPAVNLGGSDSPPKRKHEGSDPIPPKRQELEKPMPAAVEEDDEDDDSDGSIHLNMELDEDDEDEDE